MKLIIDYIKEGLKVNSKSKINSPLIQIAKILNIDEKYAEEIFDKYLNMNYLDLDKEQDKKLPCTQFELIFMLCAMLVQDKMLISHFTKLGLNGYKVILHGTNNPYDYSWFEEEIEDEDGTKRDLLYFIKNKFKFNKNVKKKYSKNF